MKVNLSENAVKSLKVVCTASAVLVASWLGWKIYKKQTTKVTHQPLTVSTQAEISKADIDDQKEIGANEAELAAI